MEFMDVLKARKSVRSYIDKEVEEAKLMKMLEAARIAPSWANKQCWSYIIIKDKPKIRELACGLANSWLKKAPVVVVECGNPKESGSRDGKDYHLVDVAISMEHLVLAATDLGLGTCWIGVFDEVKVKQLLGVPEDIRVIALTPVGYASDEGLRAKLTKGFVRSGKRKSIEEIVHYDKW